MTLAIANAAPLDSSLFKRAMRQLAGAVSVVTVGEGDDLTGFTATSVTSLSVAPPAILVCLNRASSSWAPLQRYKHFCVNILTTNHQGVAQQFAGFDGSTGLDRYRGASWQSLATGGLALSGALASIDCELEEAIERHSHAILIGRVRAVTTGTEGQPLLYWHGAYRELLEEPEPELRERRTATGTA